jgi:sulfate transport system substrate-binding protein
MLAGASAVAAATSLGVAGEAFAQAAKKPLTILNVSYDPTRELYKEINAKFTAKWKAQTGQTLTINQSHGGSGRQARSVIDGLAADVVTLALAYDIDEIAQKSKALPLDWQKRYPSNSTPYTSTIVLLTRKGNPWKIKDWGDLIKPGIGVVTPNPKTSGGARWNYLAAWEWAKRQPGGSDNTAKEFVRKLFRQVPILDTGARGSLVTFAQRNIGDVFLSWENEAHLAKAEFGDKFDIVFPSLSVLAEPPVAAVDKNTKKKGSAAAVDAYIKYLYTEEAQEIIAKNFYRPRSAAALAKYRANFPNIPLFTVDQAFGGWLKAQKTHFADRGAFDQIYQPGVR